MFDSPWRRHKDLISIHDLSAEDVETLFQLAANVKARPDRYRTALAGQTLAMIFEKSSTRTRVSFEVGMYQLGGLATFLSSRDIQIGRGEPISDTARVLSRYVNGIMARTFAHATVTGLARARIRSYLSEPDRGRRQWDGNRASQRAVYANRRRLRGPHRPCGRRADRRRRRGVDRARPRRAPASGRRVRGRDRCPRLPRRPR